MTVMQRPNDLLAHGAHASYRQSSGDIIERKIEVGLLTLLGICMSYGLYNLDISKYHDYDDQYQNELGSDSITMTSLAMLFISALSGLSITKAVLGNNLDKNLTITLAGLDLDQCYFRPAVDNGLIYGILLVPLSLSSMLIAIGSVFRKEKSHEGSWNWIYDRILSAVQISITQSLSVLISCLVLGKWFLTRRQGSRNKTVEHIATVFISICVCILAQKVFGKVAQMSLIGLAASVGVFYATVYGFVLGMPKSFTLGEALVFSQCLQLLFVDVVRDLVSSNIYKVPDDTIEKVNAIVEITIICVVIFATSLALTLALPKHSPRSTRPDILQYSNQTTNTNRSDYNQPTKPLTPSSNTRKVMHFGICTAAVGLFGLSLGYALTGANVAAWLLWFTFSDWRHLALAAYWACLLGGSAVWYFNNSATSKFTKSNTKFILNLRRKFYHVLVIAMFVPGLLWQPYMLSLGLVVAFLGLSVIELVRLFGIGPLAETINHFMVHFTDFRDAGYIITSHFYLLLGCAIPVWCGREWVSCISGILTLGVADAVASVAGQKWGRHRWFSSPKTFEGTMGFVASLVVAVTLINLWLYIAGSSSLVLSFSQLLKYAVIALFSGILEAVSLQNDNLMIPLFTFAATNLTI